MTSRELISKLAIVGEDILSEAAKQPLLFVDAAAYRVAAMRKRATAVAAIEQKRAHLVLRKRAEKDDLGKKVTEGEIKANVEASKIIASLRHDVDRAYETEEFAKLIIEAYRMRRDAIRIIAEAENFGRMSGSKEIENIEQRKKMVSQVRTLEARRRRVERDQTDDDD